MISLLSFLLLCGIISAHLGDAQKLPKVKKLNMKVHFNITGDTLVMKFHRPNENIKLEGFILGYGSNYFTNQYIQWPENGKSFITDVESETRYLIAVKPNENHKKTCKAEKNSVQKPLQVVIGSLTPTSVFLSWGILINPQVDWSALNKCPNDRFYTVRYREKNKDWHFQLCPTTETVIDNLKPNTFYEFGVKDNSDDGIWSKSQNHKTNTKGKENGNIENTYKIPKGTLQYASEDTKTLIPVYVVKQGFQNITKSTTAPLPTERSPVPRVETKKPHFRTTTRASTPKPKPVSKVTASTPVTKPAGKPVPEEPKAVTHPFIQVNNKPTEPSVIYGQSTPLASPTIVPVPFTYESPTEQPETVLAIERLATYVPEAMTIQQSLYGMYPTSTDVPDVSSSKFLIRQRSTMGIQQMPTDVSQLSTDLPLQIHRTAPGVQSISTFMSKGNIQLPLKTRRTTLAANEKQSIYVPTTVSSLGELQAHYATTSQNIPAKQSVLPSQTHAQTTTAFTGGPHITTKHKSIEVPPSPPVPKETASFHPKPFPSTEAPLMESDSTEPDSEMHTNEASHTHQPEKMTLASDDKTVLKFTSTSKPKTTAALKRTRVSPAHPKMPLPEETSPAAVLKDIQPTKIFEETTTVAVPTETQKMSPKKIHITESPSLPADPKTSHLVPPDALGFDISAHPELPLVPNKTEKAISSKSNKTTPPATPVPKTFQTKKMPINLIRIHIVEDATVPSANIETQTSSPPIPKTTQSNKMLHSKPAPKSTQRVPIHVIRLNIVEELDVPMVPNTTITPYQPTTTQRPESPLSKPVPMQKITQRIIKTPKTTPHAKPVSTEAPKDTIKPKIPHVTLATTLAPYRLQDTSSKPKSSLRPRTRPAQNGTTQGLIRARPTGEFNWVPGTIPGAKIYDNTKLLGSSRNISMTPDNTGKNKFSVSATPLPPVRPTSMRRRVQTGNVTGRPGVAVSAPPFSPVRPTSIHRRPQPTKVTGRPGSAGDILIPRAPSTARPSLTSISIKTPRKQPTLPAPEDDLEDPTVFSPSPKSDIDALGKKRFEAPHVLYMGKNETVPCSITESLKHFPTEESTNQEILNAPQNPPSNLTVVTVEGCSSFVILDWDQSDNDTVTEYKVISKENGGPPGKDQSILITNQTHSTVENLKPNTSYEFQVIPQNPLGEGPVSATVEFSTESADPRVSEPVSGGKDAIWTQIKFKSDSYSECKGKQYVKRTWYKKFVGIQLCNSLRYKIYLSDTLSGTFYNIGDQSGFGEDHCQFVDSFLDGRTGQQLLPEYLASRKGFYRSVRQQPVDFGQIGGHSHIGYVHWYECGIAIPGKW
ncbi:target of Nesh-SH3 isoform X5 [Pseudophryne corroboree]|uniref:target of Nesh-SH3 isoform X5 n=1 Tax=Pseudophryne corroboree TaxID=495146 RepID=UPI0030815E6A